VEEREREGERERGEVCNNTMTGRRYRSRYRERWDEGPRANWVSTICHELINLQ